jgi:hypothetical protein
VHAPSVAALEARERGSAPARRFSREDERGVLACCDVDAAGVAHAKPFLGDRRDGVAVALDLVLVVHDVPVRLHVGAVLDVDCEASSDPDQRRSADARLRQRLREFALTRRALSPIVRHGSLVGVGRELVFHRTSTDAGEKSRAGYARISSIPGV